MLSCKSYAAVFTCTWKPGLLSWKSNFCASDFGLLLPTINIIAELKIILHLVMSFLFDSSCFQISSKTEPKRQRLFTHQFLPMIVLLSAAFFIGSAFIITDYKEVCMSKPCLHKVEN